MKKTYYSPKIASLATVTNLIPFAGSFANYKAAQTLSIEDYSIWNSVSSSTIVTSFSATAFLGLCTLSQEPLFSKCLFGVVAGYAFNYFTNNYAELNYEINTVKPLGLGDTTTFETDI